MRIKVANSQFVIQRTTSKKRKAFLWNQNTVMVPYLIGSHYLSENKKSHWAKAYKGGSRQLGHLADCNLENRNSQAKVRDNKSKERGQYKSSTTWKMLQKKRRWWLPPKFNWWTITKRSFQTRIECDAQLTELRVEEHYEERVGTNILWAFILCFLNHEPSHVTTLQKS